MQYDKAQDIQELKVVYIGPVINNYNLQQMSNPHIYVVWSAESR